MSTLKVDNIEQYGVNGVSLNNNTSVSGKLTVTGGAEVTGSVVSKTTGAQSITTTNNFTGTGTIQGGTFQGSLAGATAAFSPSYAGVLNFYTDATGDDFGLSNDMYQWGYLGDWTGPGVFANDPSDNYPTIVGFQNKASWTDGRVTFLTPTVHQSSAYVTGSVQITQTLKLVPNDPLPAGTLGELAVSGSNLYFHNGSGWQLK